MAMKNVSLSMDPKREEMRQLFIQACDEQGAATRISGCFVGYNLAQYEIADLRAKLAERTRQLNQAVADKDEQRERAERAEARLAEEQRRVAWKDECLAGYIHAEEEMEPPDDWIPDAAEEGVEALLAQAVRPDIHASVVQTVERRGEWLSGIGEALGFTGARSGWVAQAEAIAAKLDRYRAVVEAARSCVAWLRQAVSDSHRLGAADWSEAAERVRTFDDIDVAEKVGG